MGVELDALRMIRRFSLCFYRSCHFASEISTWQSETNGSCWNSESAPPSPAGCHTTTSSCDAKSANEQTPLEIRNVEIQQSARGEGENRVW